MRISDRKLCEWSTLRDELEGFPAWIDWIRTLSALSHFENLWIRTKYKSYLQNLISARIQKRRGHNGQCDGQLGVKCLLEKVSSSSIVGVVTMWWELQGESVPSTRDRKNGRISEKDSEPTCQKWGSLLILIWTWEIVHCNERFHFCNQVFWFSFKRQNKVRDKRVWYMNSTWLFQERNPNSTKTINWGHTGNDKVSAGLTLSSLFELDQQQKSK